MATSTAAPIAPDREHCPLCRSAAFRRLRVADSGHTVVRCAGCGLVRRHPRPPAADLARHYADRYYQDQERFGAERIVTARLPLYRHYLADWAAKGRSGRLLDVGAGYGHFVQLAAAAGWDASGIEISPGACRVAADELGVRVQQGALSDVPLPRDWFDLVTLWNVADQMADPVVELQRVHRVLRPGGVVCVRVPNVAFHRLADAGFRAGRPVFQRLGVASPALFMTYSYSATTLRRLLAEAGFARVTVRNSPLTVGDPYRTLGIGQLGARAVKTTAHGFAELLAEIDPDWLFGPSLYAEGVA